MQSVVHRDIKAVLHAAIIATLLGARLAITVRNLNKTLQKLFLFIAVVFSFQVFIS